MCMHECVRGRVCDRMFESVLKPTQDNVGTPPLRIEGRRVLAVVIFSWHTRRRFLSTACLFISFAQSPFYWLSKGGGIMSELEQ